MILVSGAATTGRSAGKGASEGVAAADTRSAILEATIAIMQEEGYAAVSSRRIAAQAGLRSKLVHYYFKTMDELFLAVYKRIEDRHFTRLTQAMAAPRPIRAIWLLNMDSTNTSMVLELTAMANHRKALRTEIARASERFRQLQAAMLERAIREASQQGSHPPPIVMSVLALALSRLLAMDSVLGVSAGHDETLRWIEGCLDAMEGNPPPGSSATDA